MDSSALSPSASPRKPTFACVSCSDRKVKCDKQSPCSTCVRHNVECIFRPLKPSRRHRKIVTTRDELLEERLKRCEALLQEKGIDPSQATGTSVESASEVMKRPQSSSSDVLVTETIWHMPTSASTVSGPQATTFKPQLLRGEKGTRLVDNSLWSRVSEEIHSAENAPDEDSTDDASDEDETDFAYVLGSKTHKSAATHPPAEIVQRLWQVYVENVDPLTKVVHVPSLQRAIEKAITDVHRIPKGFEALMFAIYSMAILSLTDTECKETLGDNRATLLPQYVAATKTALSRARFMSSTSVVVLQALMLHILSIRDDYEPRAVWSLTGAAIRIAEGMGMRHDGTLLGLSPFETEIYRRIWWQLKMHDFKASELAGQAKFRDFEIDASTPKKPANVNDSDLYPSMTHAAPESEQLTDMIWITFRCDLASFAASQKVSMQKQGKAVFTSEEYVAMDDLTIKDGFIKKMQDMIETKYLRYCDPTDPLQLLTLLCGRAAANLVRFMAHHPRRWANMDQVPAAEQEFVWSIVIQLMEQFNMMRTSPQIRRFAWNAPYFIQWHAVIHILDTLRAHPLRPDAAKAWQLIGSLYEHNEAMLLSLKRPILVAVGNLCLKAWSARAAALARENRPPPKEPDYIAKLREQRQAAKVRREAALAKKRGMGNSGLLANNVKITDQGLYRASSDSVSEDKRQQFSAAAQAPNSGLDDAYWLSDGMNNDLFNGGASDPMNLDSDAILAQASWTDTPNSEVIDWGQWDSWFGSLDPRPNAGVGVN